MSARDHGGVVAVEAATTIVDGIPDNLGLHRGDAALLDIAMNT